jgi:hypothetical protein
MIFLRKLLDLALGRDSTPPATGQLYGWRPTKEDPFPSKGDRRVEVLEVKDGWVRYRFLPVGGWFQDERLTVYCFNHCYWK